MSDSPSSPPQGAHPAPSSHHAQPAPIPHVVNIRAQRSGIWNAVGFVVILMLFGVVFFAGLIFGVGAMLVRSTVDSVVIEHTYRDATFRSRDKIAILPIEGIIDDSQAYFARAAVEHILDDSRVRAVILRVDSPGGGVTASDEIWDQIERLKSKNIPVIASYGGLAASGGYYISCGADHIIAQETAITGSIGVIAQVLTLQNLMDKIGIEPVTLVATGSPEKNVANDIFRQWNERDQEKILSFLDHYYDIFTQRVAQSRTPFNDPEKLQTAATGSVFTAREALELGLIDAIGYLDDAIAHAETVARIPAGRAQVVRIDAPPSLFGALLGAQSSGFAASRMDGDSIRSFVSDLSTPRFKYLMW